MKDVFYFDCNGNSSPAYSCDKPGDNSGSYIQLKYVVELENVLTDILEAHDMSTVDWEAMRKAKALLRS